MVFSPFIVPYIVHYIDLVDYSVKSNTIFTHLTKTTVCTDLTGYQTAWYVLTFVNKIKYLFSFAVKCDIIQSSLHFDLDI